MNTIKRGAALALALVFALVSLTGCFRGKKTDDADADATNVPTASPQATAEPEQGGILRLPMPVNAPSADPLEVTTEEMLYLFSLVYESLLTVSSTGELEPCLCESWTSEAEGVWLLHLREGVTWHDGTSFRSQDVVTTYNSLCNMENSYYSPCLKHILRLDAVGNLAVRVTLDTPGIMGLYSLVFPIKKKVSLMGTGPYMLEHISDEQIVLKVNDAWWDKLPYITKVIFSERDSNTTALASYEAGQLDMVPTDILTAGKYAEAGVTNVMDIMTQNMEVLLFNSRCPVFSDVNMRLAVAHGINRSRIITNVYSNRARSADVPIPPDSWLYDSRCAVFNYDTALAAELIAGAGYTIESNEDGLLYAPSGVSLRIRLLTSATTENTIRSDAANMIASQLEQLGFSCEVVTAPHTLGDSESEFIKALSEGDWDIALVGFNLALSNELTSYIDPNGVNNYGHMADSDLSALARNMLNAATEEEAREAAYAFQTCFVEKPPFLPLYFRLNSVICSAEIKGTGLPREPLLFADIKNWYWGAAE